MFGALAVPRKHKQEIQRDQRPSPRTACIVNHRIGLPGSPSLSMVSASGITGACGAVEKAAGLGNATLITKDLYKHFVGFSGFFNSPPVSGYQQMGDLAVGMLPSSVKRRMESLPM